MSSLCKLRKSTFSMDDGSVSSNRRFSNHLELANDFHEILCALFEGATTRVDNSFCVGIEALPAGQDRAQLFHGFRVTFHRAEIALFAHALHMLFRARSQPYRVEVAQKIGEGFWLCDDSARDGEHRFGSGRHNSFERLSFETPVTFLTIQRHNFVDRNSTNLFDFAVQFQKWQGQLLAHDFSERRLAGSAETDQA